jgi:hypothetical protein
MRLAAALAVAVLDMTTGVPVSPKHGSTCVTVLER